MPPAPETASAPSTCSGSSLRSVEPKCSCPSNQSPVRPRPSAASKISPKGEAKRRRDHQRLLSKLRNIIPRIVQTTPIDPKVTQGSRRAAPQLPSRPRSHPRQQARTRRSCRPRPTVPKGGRREAPRPPPGPEPATATCPHISPAVPTNNGPITGRLPAASPQVGAGLSFQNTPQTSVAPCPRLRRSRTRRHAWSRTF